jgi:hypothetical protein
MPLGKSVMILSAGLVFFLYALKLAKDKAKRR